MKTIIVRICVLLSAILVMAGCKKDKEEPQTGLYHFNFKVDGTAYNFKGDVPQYISDNANEVGGFQMNNNTAAPNISLSFLFLHNPSEAEVMSLVGRTFYFDGSYPNPEITFDGGAESGAEKYQAQDTLSAAYNVKVNSVTFVKSDETSFNKIDVYQITGTCKAFLQNNQDASKHMILTDGDFKFLVSRVK